MNSQLTNVLSRPLPFNKKNTMLRWNNSTRSIPEFQVMYSRKRSNPSSAPTSFRTTTFPPAMSVNFPIPTCLHSSCRCQTSVDSRCHLLFGKQHNHTWALCHGTTVKTAQLILLEGKIRPANWSYHKNPQRCHLPTFGAFYLGREVSNAEKTIPAWAETALLDSMEKKGKGQQDVTVGAMYRGSDEHIAFKAGGNEKAQLGVGDKGI